MKRVLLVSMPWQNFLYPSMQLGALKAAVQSKENIECDTLYGYLFWAEYICKKWKDKKTNEVFEFLGTISLEYAYQCLGDWIFTKALYGYDYRKKEYLNYLTQESGCNITQEVFENIVRLYEDAPGFMDYLLQKVNIESYDVIGFTNTFSQTVSSVAFAKKIKEFYPNVTIVMGGANCDDVQGKTLIKKFKCLDYALSGEGEESLPRFIETFDKEDFDTSNISGLIYRKEDQTVEMSEEILVNEENTLYPEYDDYFELLEKLKISELIQPKILMEISKGCWWGDKSHCAFCGINEKRTKFRCKSEDKIIENIIAYSKHYSCGDIFIVDNIMNNSYYNSLLPKMKELNYDFDLFWEIKANLTRKKAMLLRDSNVRNLQPGIENFSTEVLKEMGKGVTGIQNIYTLKLAREYGLNISWNILCGLPKEKDEYYTVDKWKGLYHLEAPMSHGRIVLERHSPLFDETERGIINNGPAEPYYYIYDFDKENLYDYAYMFKNERCGISDEKELELKQLVEEWNNNKDAVLFHKKRKDILEIVDARSSRKCRQYYIEELVYVDALLYLEDIRSFEDLYKYLSIEKNYDISKGELDKWLTEMIDLRFIYDENNRYLSLVLPYNRVLYENM